MISRSNRCFIAVLYHVAPTFAVIISLRKPTPAEPIHGDSFHQPSLLRYEVHRNLCSREFLAHLEKWEWTEGQAGVPEVFSAIWITPDVNVDVSGDDEISRLAARDPQSWKLCLLPSVPSNALPVCSALTDGESRSFTAGCCAGFGESPRSLALTLDVWLERRRGEHADGDRPSASAPQRFNFRHPFLHNRRSDLSCRKGHQQSLISLPI